MTDQLTLVIAGSGVIGTIIISAITVTWRISKIIESHRNEANIAINNVLLKVEENKTSSVSVESKLTQQAHDGELFHNEVRDWLKNYGERILRLELRKTRKR